MTIYLGADHAGFERKEHMKAYLLEQGHAVEDLGAHELDLQDDYPDYAVLVAKKVMSEPSRGILFCGSGQGICIAANKIDGIRAALAYNEQSAEASRTDDDANVLCLPARDLTDDQVKRIIETWLSTEFSEAERHKRRIEKIRSIEQM